MVKIRLRRTGAKKQPHYRVVVAEAKNPRDGRFLEVIGHYNPRTDPPTVEIDAERALYWLSVGAQPSPAVKRLLDRENITAQVAAVRKGQVSIKDLAAEFRQTQVETEAKLATRAASAMREPMFQGQEEEEEEATPAAEEAFVPAAEAEDLPLDFADTEEEEEEEEEDGDDEFEDDDDFDDEDYDDEDEDDDDD